MDREEKSKVSPILCIIGNVNVGKTLLADTLRMGTTVQKKEIGGITQQIGSTYISKEAIDKLSSNLSKMVEIPGILILDTPGHDCFDQMRLIGTSICNMAIVVVDIVKGLEKQTIQYIQLLQKSNTYFIVALNKLDRVFGWVPYRNSSLKQTLNKQNSAVKSLIKQYSNHVIAQFAEMELNAALYYENKNTKEFISMVPVSATTGEGISDLITLISKLITSRIQKQISEPNSLYKFTFGYIMDIKTDEIFGLIHHIILVNGTLNRGDTLELETGSIVVDEIYVPADDAEFKGKSRLKSVQSVEGTKGIAIKLSPNTDAIGLGNLFIKHVPTTELQDLQTIIGKHTLKSNENYNFSKNGIVINVPAKSMVHAMMKMAEASKITVRMVTIGKLSKSSVIKATHSEKPATDTEELVRRKLTVILDFDSNQSAIYDDEIQRMAKENGITIISDSVIHKLFDKYNEHSEKINDKIRKRFPGIVPQVSMTILPDCIFLKRNPLLFGVQIEQGTLVPNVTIVAEKDSNELILGKVVGIQKNNKAVESATNDRVCIKIEPLNEIYEYGNHFDTTWKLKLYRSTEDQEIIKQYGDILRIMD